MNWKTIIKEIIASGMTQSQIASEIGCSQSLISDIHRGYRGKSVSHKIGDGLVSLHKKINRGHANAD